MIWRHWIPALIYAALIFFLSHQSDPPGAELGPDYLGHLLEYGFFSLTIAWGLTQGLQLPLTGGRVATALLLATLYGALDEFHQSFIPEREASWQDLLMDVAGAMLFLLACYLLCRTLRSEG